MCTHRSLRLPASTTLTSSSFGSARCRSSTRPDEVLGHDFVTELVDERTVSSPTYERTVEGLGLDATVDLVGHSRVLHIHLHDHQRRSRCPSQSNTPNRSPLGTSKGEG